MPKFIDNLYVRDSSKVTREIADKDGYLYQRNSKITATATELNTLSGTEKAIKTKKVALGVADTGGGANDGKECGSDNWRRVYAGYEWAEFRRDDF